MTKAELDDLRVRARKQQGLLAAGADKKADTVSWLRTATPTVVLALLDEIAELRWRLEELRK